MRKINYLIVVLSSLAFCSGCQKDMLSNTPQKWFKDDQDAEEFAYVYELSKLQWEIGLPDEDSNSLDEDSNSLDEDPSKKIKILGPNSIDSDLSEPRTYSWYVTYPVDSNVDVLFPGVDVDPNVIQGWSKGIKKVVLNSSQINGVSKFNIEVIPINGRGTIETESKTIKVSREGSAGATFQIEDDLNARKHFGDTFSKAFFCIKVFITNDYGYPLQVNSASINLFIDYIMRLKEPKNPKVYDLMKYNDYEFNLTDMIIKYKGKTYVIWTEERVPMNFSAILNTFEFDKRHDKNNIIIELLRSAGVIAGGVSGFNVGGDYDKISSFIQGPVTGELAKHLLADLIAHLGFLNDYALHETVIIPAESSVARYVFLPRGDITGKFGLELPVRIMGIVDESPFITGFLQLSQEKQEFKITSEMKNRERD